jgi:dTDP-4-dehydrorhamnose reductase
MNKNILIIGSKSSLAKHILEKFKNSNFKISSISRKDFNFVKDFKKLEKIIIKKKPKIIINCVAIKYEECEKSTKDAYEVNAFFPYKLAVVCEKINVILIHFSTEAVFDGNKKYLCGVEDIPQPNSMYGKSKLLGDYSLIGFKNSLIIRVSLLFGKFFKKNFVYNILTELKKNKRINISNDIFCTPTNAEDIANFLVENIRGSKLSNLLTKKIIHLSSNNLQTRYKLISDMALLLNKSKYIKPISIKNLKVKIVPRATQGIKSNVKNFKISKIEDFIKSINI